MKELNKQFWKETSKLIDAHRKNNDERAAQGVVDSRIVFNKLVKKLTIPDVVGQSEQLKALEDLKDFAYDNCQPHNSDRLSEIMERL